MNHLGIDVIKRKYKAALKNEMEMISDKSFFGNNSDGILEVIKRIHNHRTKKVLCSNGATGSMLMRYI